MMASKFSRGGQEQPVAAVIGVLHRMAGLAQALHDEAGNVLVVLHDQYAHRYSPN